MIKTVYIMQHDIHDLANALRLLLNPTTELVRDMMETGKYSVAMELKVHTNITGADLAETIFELTQDPTNVRATTIGDLILIENEVWLVTAHGFVLIGFGFKIPG